MLPKTRLFGGGGGRGISATKRSEKRDTGVLLLTKIVVRWVMRRRSHGVVILAFELHWIVVVLRSVEHLGRFWRQKAMGVNEEGSALAC